MPALEDEENLVREYYYWVPPVNHIPPGAEISPEEQRIEDEIARKHPNRGSSKWSSGGWLKFKGENLPRGQIPFLIGFRIPVRRRARDCSEVLSHDPLLRPVFNVGTLNLST